MSESRRTIAFVAVAAILSALAWATGPGSRARDDRDDRGQLLFPALTDPDAATSLEVIEFDGALSMPRPFKVANRDGRWTIPSQADYPADGATRLSSIASAMIALRKDDVAGEVPADHARFGVLDPLDETLPDAAGRGTRITVRGRNDVLLADVIAGDAVEGRPPFRYVRVPGERRVYVARLDVEISTRFEDWIERNLLSLDRDDIDQIAIRNYTADPRTGSVREIDRTFLRISGGRWTADGLRASDAIDTFTMNLLVTRLVELTVAGVVPKPAAVAERLNQPAAARLGADDVSNLAAHGFYFTGDGRLLASQGEVLVHTTSGVFYALRFGEARAVAGGERPGRYLFVSVGFDAGANAGPSDPVRAKLDLLRARFSPWYYVVADEDVSKIRVPRATLIGPRRPQER